MVFISAIRYPLFVNVKAGTYRSLTVLNLFNAFKYALRLASIMSVLEPLPFTTLLMTFILTETSPRASFPAVTALRLYAIRRGFTPAIFLDRLVAGVDRAVAGGIGNHVLALVL